MSDSQAERGRIEHLNLRGVFQTKHQRESGYYQDIICEQLISSEKPFDLLRTYRHYDAPKHSHPSRLDSYCQPTHREWRR